MNIETFVTSTFIMALVAIYNYQKHKEKKFVYIPEPDNKQIEDEFISEFMEKLQNVSLSKEGAFFLLDEIGKKSQLFVLVRTPEEMTLKIGMSPSRYNN